jgi:hypothetical protein
MLHDLQVAACEKEMMVLVNFQKKLLELAFELASGVPSAGAKFQEVLGNDAGSWFWEKYSWTNVKHASSEWKKLLDNLAIAYQKDSTVNLGELKTTVIDAFEHDIQFHEHLEDSNWGFKFNELSSDIREAIKELFVKCYNDFTDGGYSKQLDTSFGDTVNREYFLLQFFASNPNIQVCPVCDARLEKRKSIRICKLDHFFPKATYPFLSLHPYNLVPTCDNCNTAFKGEKNPLAENEKEITPDAFANTYLSYQGRAILKLGKITAQRQEYSEPIGELSIDIEDTLTGGHKRKQAAQRVVGIPGRWTENITEVAFDRLVEFLTADSCERKRIGCSITDLGDTLRSRLREYRSGKNEYDVLRTAYIQYAIGSNTEQERLFIFFSGQNVDCSNYPYTS